jgi:hypothetical protein
MPNNPTYQSIYAKLQDILPDTQREHAIQLLSELSIVMFSPSGDLQSNVQSTDADTIFTPNQRTDLQLLQTMAAYIKEAKKESRPYMVQRGGGGGGDGGDGEDGWNFDDDEESDEEEEDKDPGFKPNLKKNLAEERERRLMRQRHYRTWRYYTITLEFFISFMTMQESKLREVHLELRNECRTKSQILAKMRRNETSNEVSLQYYSFCFTRNLLTTSSSVSRQYPRHANMQRFVETMYE